MMRATVLLCLFLLVLTSPAVFAGCPKGQRYCITVNEFGDGWEIMLMAPRLRAKLLTEGATLSAVQYLPTFANHKTQWVDVALGFDNPEEFHGDTAYMGRVVGRYAGRIAGGNITVDGKLYELPKNDGNNTLHGGPDGLSFRQWNYTIFYSQQEVGVRFEVVSPHLDQGFPGDVHVTATYTILKDELSTLKWNLQAVLLPKSPVNSTIINLCNHVYWNLNGVPREQQLGRRELPAPITNHFLELGSSHFLETDAELIPWGDVRLVNGTAHDYRRIHSLKDGIEATAQEGRDPAGYDDPFSLDDWDGKLHKAVGLVSQKSQIAMTIATTSPAVVMYTANHLPDQASGLAGERYQKHSGIALETQFFPNSPHVPKFPSTELKKGQKYDETTVCSFATIPREPPEAS